MLVQICFIKFYEGSTHLGRGSLLSLKLLLFHLIRYCLCRCIRLLLDEPEWWIYIIVVDVNLFGKIKLSFTYLPQENSSCFLPPQLLQQTSPQVMWAAQGSEHGADKTDFPISVFKPLTIRVIPRLFLIGIWLDQLSHLHTSQQSWRGRRQPEFWCSCCNRRTKQLRKLAKRQSLATFFNLLCPPASPSTNHPPPHTWSPDSDQPEQEIEL